MGEGKIFPLLLFERRKMKRPLNPVFEESFGEVKLTKFQIEIILKATEGREHIGNHGGTKQVIENRIYAGTGWSEMKFIQLCCRFAYKHGLVKL